MAKKAKRVESAATVVTPVETNPAAEVVRGIAAALGWPVKFPDDLAIDLARLAALPAGTEFLWMIHPSGTWLTTIDRKLGWYERLANVYDAFSETGDDARAYVWTGGALSEVASFREVEVLLDVW